MAEVPVGDPRRTMFSSTSSDGRREFEALQAENARLREEVKALRGNRWAGFTDRLATVCLWALGAFRHTDKWGTEDYKDADQLIREIRAELARREAENDG